MFVQGPALDKVSIIQTLSCIRVYPCTYIVADCRIVLGWESSICLRLLEGQKHVRELRVNQDRKGWEAEDNGKESEDAHIGYVRG